LSSTIPAWSRLLSYCKDNSFRNAVDCSIYSLKIINCLLRIKLQFFRNEQNFIAYVEFIVKGLGNIIKNKQGLDNLEILQELTSAVSKSNRNCNMEMLLSSQDYIEWLEIVYALTLEAISSFPQRISIMQNLVVFWSYFILYAHRIRSQNVGVLHEYILKVDLK